LQGYCVARILRCKDIARNIWQWTEDRDIWINIAYIPGKQNTLADDMIRTFKNHLEHWGTPDVDLFASRLNNKLQRLGLLAPGATQLESRCFYFHMGKYNYFTFCPNLGE
jgi:hypothetical protein